MPAIHLSQREKHIAWLCMTVIAGAIIYNYILAPGVHFYDELRKDIEINEVALAKNQRIISLAGTISKNYQQLVHQVKTSGSDEINEMFTDIERIVSSTGVAITDVKPLETEEKEFYNQYMVNIEGEANIKDIATFIYHLQSPENGMKVKKLRISARGSSKSRGQTQLNLSMLISRIRIP